MDGPEELLMMNATTPLCPVASRTVRDLAAGSDVTLQDRGMCLLKGINGGRLLAVARP
jgi:hypothetical protein